jgi:hypothetical protein
VLCFVLSAPIKRLWAQMTSSAPLEPNSVEAFVDVTQRLGVNFQHRASHTSRKYLLETMGAGVALFDYDNDGR